MSLDIQIQNLTTRIGTEFKTVYSKVGSLTNLTTRQKADIVQALNGLQADLSALQNATSINDSAAETNTTWSGKKVQDSITAAINALVNGAPAALDTLKELADQLATDEGTLNALVASVGNRVRYDAAQTLSAAQQQQARDNIGAVSAAAIGNTERDFVAVFNAALQ